MEQFIFHQFQKMIEATMLVGEQAANDIQEAAQCLSSSLLNGRTIFTAGDENSTVLAQLLNNYLCGGLEFERPGFPALNLNRLTNSEGAERFATALQLHAQPGDCLVAISAGNNHLGLLSAMETAAANQLNIVLLCNSDDRILAENLAYNDVQVNLGDLSGPLLTQGQLQAIHCTCAAIDKIVFGAE